VDRALPGGACQALRLEGSFDLLTLRSVHRQTRPYPPLAEVAAHQNVFTLHNAEGTLVGFRFPDYTQGLEVPGYHLHFISADRTIGGHVLDSRLSHGTLALERSSELKVELPLGLDFEGPHMGGEGREALGRIEG
jgi:acetolactate decarboxylase